MSRIDKMRSRREEKQMKGGKRKEETDLTPLSGCCGFGRLVVPLGCVKFCPRVTGIFGSSVLPTGRAASTVPVASVSAG